MKVKRLKPFVFPVFSAVVAVLLIVGIITIEKASSSSSEAVDNYVYSNETITNEVKPVVEEIESDVIIRPYKMNEIDIYKKFYDENNNNDNGILFFNGTYMQSSGIIYNYKDEFDVISIYSGEVLDVKKDELLGYVVEVKHNDNLISSYSGLKSVNVKKGEKISQSTLIGKSGEMKFDSNLKNSLMFEIIKNGKYINPEELFDKKINEI
ncbi:MAG: M23 family metallopeptidase [Bacilli bacterium]|nr:M23 family metallopeptidase [Bacilli bacterium]